MLVGRKGTTGKKQPETQARLWQVFTEVSQEGVRPGYKGFLDQTHTFVVRYRALHAFLPVRADRDDY
jgi:hypothetical protein